MDTSTHSLEHLFDQLGLPSSPDEIERFIATHPTEAGDPLERAPFWSPSQARFIQQTLEEDSDWAVSHVPSAASVVVPRDAP